MKYLPAVIVCFIFLFPVKTSATEFKGAEYRTKESFLYGRFEVRLKSFQKDGALTSFFTYNDLGGDWNEIDIEIMGRYSNDVQLNTIVPTQSGNHVHHQRTDFNPSLDFHTYGFEWTPEYIAWFIDGTEIYRQTGSHISQMKLPQKLMMNVWPPQFTDWAGVWKAEQVPCFAYYDWISYSEYTPGKGSYGTGNNFTNKWRDELNEWDKNRWEMATHTFGGNLCTFTPDNITFKDGLMILSLTDNTNTGYTDKSAPAPMWGRISGGRARISFSEELDKTTAETPANYLLSGFTVNSVKLLGDQRSVELSLTQQDSSDSETVIVQNIKDRWAPGNPIKFKAVQLTRAVPLKFPIRINAGGSAVNGFMADQLWGPEAEYGYMDGSASSWTAIIRGTLDSTVYKSERNGLVCYKIRVPDGEYNVKLMMAESYYNGADSRVFNVLIEGQTVLSKFDILQNVSMRTAFEPVYRNIKVNDGELEIYFTAEKGLPVINGIVVEKVISGTEDRGSVTPDEFRMEQNYPNPFNGMTRINFNLKKRENVLFRIFDLLGRQVYSRIIDTALPGENTFIWKAADGNGHSLASGVYYYSITTEKAELVKKMLLLN